MHCVKNSSRNILALPRQILASVAVLCKRYVQLSLGSSYWRVLVSIAKTRKTVSFHLMGLRTQIDLGSVPSFVTLQSQIDHCHLKNSIVSLIFAVLCINS
jgi:hypothetical protein